MRGHIPELDLPAIRGQVAADARAVAQVVDSVDESFADLAAMIHAAAGKVITTASGNSGAVAQRLAHMLSLGGTPAFYLDANQALHGAIGAVTAADILVVLSKGGVTQEVNECATLAHAVGAAVIAVTEAEQSPLADMADRVHLLPASGADYHGLIGMGSSLAQAAWSDALTVALVQLRDIADADLAARHPRGLVGHLAAQGELG